MDNIRLNTSSGAGPPDPRNGEGRDPAASTSAQQPDNATTSYRYLSNPAGQRYSLAALALAEAGLPVLPLLPRTKRPRLLGGYKSATTDPAAVADAWDRNPFDNVGIRPPAGVFVMDVDPRNGGENALAHLVAEYGPLPPTWAARTGSGGWHYWLRADRLDRLPGKLSNGIDLKHGGTGYVVAPPSELYGAGRYVWMVPPDGPLATAPEWLTRLASRRHTAESPNVAERGAQSREWASPNRDTGQDRPYSLACLAARVRNARQGHRNTTLYGALKDALRQGVLAEAETVLKAAALANGLGEVEIAATLRSVRGTR